jgi:hypothetical protein
MKHIDEATLRSAISAELRSVAKPRKALKPEDALAAANEHIGAAAKCRATLPGSFLTMHAHVKAADGFLESYRRDGTPVADPQAEDEDPDPTILSPEGRQTRAQAAIMLHIGGSTAEARRLVRSTTKRPPRGRK